MIKERICNGNQRLLCVVFSLISILLYGCATTMEVSPKVEQTNNIDFRINGEIIYEGNKEYLPRMLIDKTDSDFAFQYTYNAVYGKHDVPDIVAFLNPLNLVGFPTGGNTLTVAGKLDILREKEVVKSYIATCVLEKTRSLLFEGETFSEMRKKGLIAVRDNIEVQIYQDRDILKNLSDTK